ncbi:RING-type E3 ubiquitin transferase [Sarracenia purpurea var. burkii]
MVTAAARVAVAAMEAGSVRPAEIVAPQSANPREAPHRDGIEELDQEPTQNDRPSTAPPPAPAPESAIEALPTVNVTETHLVSDSHCPVCKEEFEVGGEARVMPCNHLYHSDCIVPWLRIQRTCPVCRYELQGFSNDDDRDGGGGDFQAANGYPLTWPRIQSVSLWPSRLFSNWMYGDDLNSQTGTMSGSRGVPQPQPVRRPPWALLHGCHRCPPWPLCHHLISSRLDLGLLLQSFVKANIVSRRAQLVTWLCKLMRMSRAATKAQAQARTIG